LKLYNQNSTGQQWNLTTGIVGQENNSFCIRDATNNVNAFTMAKTSGNANFAGNINAASNSFIYQLDSSGNAILDLSSSGGQQIRFFDTNSSYTEAMRILRFDDKLSITYGDNANEEALTVVGGTGSSAGRVFVNNNTYSRDALMHIEGNSNNYALYLYAPVQYAGIYRYQRFWSGNNIAGGIDGSNQTSVQYVTTSDYRTKKNIKPLENGLDRVCKLKPVKFDWKLNNETTEGFIAHEVQDIFPEAVSGEKDGQEMQGMDYGRITPLLVKAIQELKAEVDKLKQECKCKN
jgi:hypothetical protein